MEKRERIFIPRILPFVAEPLTDETPVLLYCAQHETWEGTFWDGKVPHPACKQFVIEESDATRSQ